jgi:aspartyl-tRNA(Asn)/glutamyl-tRNA(Gln) amidotransferase subunit A
MPTIALLSLADAARKLRIGEVSPTDLTHACLERIDEHDPILNAFITLTREQALEQARQAEVELAAGHDRGLLHGIPIGLKDLIDTAGVRTTAASGVFADRVPDTDAEVVRRLRAAGAVILGKLNLHELAYGGSGVVSFYGPAKNPRHPAYLAGGSSSGAAAAVGAGMCYAALGSDTSGSIRVPAALSGVVGHKPTYGLVSVRGVMPLSPSYDTVGPLARTVGDARLVHDVIAGYDALDIYSAAPPPEVARGPDGAPRIGIARAFVCDGLDAEVAERFAAALTLLATLARSLTDVVVPIDDDRTVFRAESVAVHRHHMEKTPELYQAETLRRLRSGAPVASSDYIDRWQDLQRMRRGAAALFRDVDLVVTPTVPVPAPSFAEIEAAPEKLRGHELVLLRNTRPFNILGLPALSVPCGVTRAGLPVGLQIVGRPFDDARVLELGAAFERAG